MIIETILGVIYKLLELLMVFEIPDLPEQVYNYVDTMFMYLTSGVGILANYVPYEYFMTLFIAIGSIDMGILAYHLIMWIIRKLPVSTE